MNPHLPRPIPLLTIVATAIYAGWRLLGNEAGLSTTEPEPWLLTLAATGCGLFARSSRLGALLPRIGLVPVLSGIWILPPPAALLPALGFLIASRGCALWGSAHRPGWASAATGLALTAVGAEAVAWLVYSDPDSLGRLLWMSLIQAALTLGSLPTAGLQTSRNGLRAAWIDAPLVAAAWLLGTAMQPSAALAAWVSGALAIAAAYGIYRFRSSGISAGDHGDDWGGLTALRGLLQSLGGDVPSSNRFKALERTCRKLMNLDRFEIFLFDSASATGLSVHRSDGASVDDRPLPIDAASFPVGSEAQRMDRRILDGRRTLTVPLISGDERVAAVRVSRAAPEFAPREIAWLETAATLAAPELEADRDRRVRHTEPRTGLSTPDHLWTRLEEEARRAKRYKTPLALLWIRPLAGQENSADADRSSGRLLARALRDCDLCAQVEDGAFVAVLPDTGRRGATATAHRLIERLQVEWASSQRGSEPTPAVGVAVFSPEDGRPPRSLALRAEAAALSAAREGAGWRIDESGSMPEAEQAD